MPQSDPSQEDSHPRFDFEVDDSLSAWNMPANEWLQKHAKPYSGLASGNIVFNDSGKVLVIQRASTDSMPNKWEIPGGAVSDEDHTFFHGAARELWEESGLRARRFTQVVTEGLDREPGQVYPNSTNTKVWCRFAFIVEVESCETVTLEPTEHQDFTWATEDEIREQKIGNGEHPLTNQGMVSLLLEAFRLKRQKAGSGHI
jgi:8-oxo-dGTP pyrophosphatase MutT (NUDIX family)